MKRKTTSRRVPKAQVGKTIKKVGNKVEKAENAVKSTAKQAVKTAGSAATKAVKTAGNAATKADNWMEKNLRLITKSPQYKASKYVLKKVLKKNGGAVKKRK